MRFRISALAADRFAPLFAMSDAALASRHAVRRIATEAPGFPCRVSLEDAARGDELLLVNFEHQGAASPYRASHAIFVRRGVEQARPAAGEVPVMLARRALSLRAFDAQGMIVAADLLPDGRALAPALEALLAEPASEYVHVHFAKHGCYAARADRA